MVELFTSQGCNSCPPADALLGDLIGRPDLIALSLHVDYWDYLGWRDTFARSEHGERQRAYAQRANRRSVYTPEIVVGGRSHVVGSDGGAVAAAIEAARAAPGIDVSFRPDGDDYVVLNIAASKAGADARAAVLLVRFDSRQDVEIARGENAGKTLAYHNVVREIRRLGTWHGEPFEVMLSLRDLAKGGCDGAAILVQREGTGPIIGAAQLSLSGKGTAR